MASTFKRRSKPTLAASSAGGLPTKAMDSVSSGSSSMLGLRGTKPWTGGTTLTSSGLRDLDGILGGGQPLGTCLLIEEDRWTQSLAMSLVRYWCAEGLSHGHHLMIPSEDDCEDATCNYDVTSLGFDCTEDAFAEGERKMKRSGMQSSSSVGATKAEILEFLATLPRNLHWDKQQKKAKPTEQEGDASNRELMETLEEDDEEGDEEDVDEGAQNEEGLKIAWQYRKSVQRARLGHDKSSSTRSSASDNVYCHSYDLSGRLSEQFESITALPTPEDLTHLHGFQCNDNQSERICGFHLFQSLLAQITALLADKQKPRAVVRLLFYHIKPEVLCLALPLLLTQIRLKQLPVIVLVLAQPWKSATASHSKALLSLERASDVVLQTEGFAARSHYPPPPEFRHLQGLLLIRKTSTVTSATSIGGGHYADLTISKRPPANIYGLKRDRRKLHIPLLHIPPEDHAEGGGSVGGGGVRSGAGRPTSAAKPSTGGSTGCGSSNQNSNLEF